MKNRVIPSLMSLLALAAITSAAFAQGNNGIDNRQIVRATGHAIAQAQPDEVWLDIGVVTQAATAQQAAAENTRKVEKVLAALRSELGTGAAIKTVNYSLNPDYAPMREGGAPRITGYIASNIVQVRTTELTKVGKLIDAAIKADANNINRVEFTLKDQSQAVTQALREATQRARLKADAIASSLGLRVIRILEVDEGGGGRPMPYNMSRMRYDAMESATQIEPGTVDVQALVTITAEMGP